MSLARLFQLLIFLGYNAFLIFACHEYNSRYNEYVYVKFDKYDKYTYIHTYIHTYIYIYNNVNKHVPNICEIFIEVIYYSVRYVI